MPGIFDAIPTAALDFGLLAGRRSRWTHWPAPHHWWARDCDHDPGCQVSKRRYDPGKYNLYLKSFFSWRLSLVSWVLDLLCTSISVESQSLRVCFPLELIKMLPVPVPELLQNRNFGDQKSLDTSSTAQGGGGSFKNRKPIGDVGCCESGMAERSHWLTERWLELCLLEWLQWLQWSPHPQLLDVVWCTATVVVVVA